MASAVSAALLLSLMAGGCAGYNVQTTAIPHPAYTPGAVPQNRVAHEAVREEQASGLPAGALTNEASLVRMDPEALCFTVTLRNRRDPARADLHSYSMEVVDEDREPLLVAPTVTGFQQQVTPYHGLVSESFVSGTSTECVSRDEQSQQCNRWEERPIRSYRTVPGIVAVTAGAGLVCFANGSRVNPQSEEISLVLRPDRGRGIGFRWEFFVPQQAPTQFASQ